MNTTLTHPGLFPYMATIAEENEWLVRYNRYHAAIAAERGYRYYVKGLRNGTPSAMIIWWVKDTATHRLIDCFEDQIEAVLMIDAMEAQS
jgi:hypothetical protein